MDEVPMTYNEYKPFYLSQFGYAREWEVEVHFDMYIALLDENDDEFYRLTEQFVVNKNNESLGRFN